MCNASQQRLHKLISRYLELTVARFCSLFRRPFLLLNKGSTRRLITGNRILLWHIKPHSTALTIFSFAVALDQFFTKAPNSDVIVRIRISLHKKLLTSNSNFRLLFTHGLGGFCSMTFQTNDEMRDLRCPSHRLL